EQQNWQSAFGNYSKAVELKPDLTQAKAKLGRLYVFSGAVNEAENIANEILAKEPGNRGARFLKAAVMTRRGDVSGAIQETSQIVASDSTQCDAVSLRGGLYIMQGEEAKAQEILEKGVKAYPLQFSLARLYELTGKPKQAEQTYRDIIGTAKTRPEGLKARAFLARDKLATGDAAEAEKLVAEVLTENPRDSDALQLRGRM